ncbi:tetratricopeptide repeat protein [Haliea sp. E1-2-M8]|uniref:tetratricopeptide repeat protein n=1 Tax=Haliea sp. E1-2-M8 TaxID=3064706 RepID=UPI0027168C1A|nr:tetratricopeptide repeat protein [Haliea sp. E1-2-M8]MDO8863861.1 tetratricopeptide repeat protein [Haliea sp. E1-2-M8]
MQINLLLKRGFVLGLALVLTGCAIYSMPGSERAPIETRPAPGETVPDTPEPVATPVPEPYPPAPQPAATDPGVTSAAASLLEKASAASAQGDYEQALALLERAQRIDPNSAEIYLQLARVYAAQGQVEKARDTASRGTLYCRDERECNALRALAR